MPTRQDAIAAAEKWFDDGHLLDAVRRRVAHRTESQRGDDAVPDLRRYLTDEIGPSLAALGFALRIVENPVPGAGPFLVAVRHEDDAFPTALMYGHGDVVLGYDAQWRTGLSPWSLTVDGDRWYGRGTADNKGQHSINVAALGQVLAARGRLGFNVKFLLETGEETGSPGLRAMCESERTALAADVLIASDGPRLSAARPTLFLGSRGVLNFDLTVDLREGSHHSGNWGGLLANPGTILAAEYWSTRCVRRRFRSPCAARWPTSSRANCQVRRSTAPGASRDKRRRKESSRGTASKCSHSRPAIPRIPSTPFLRARWPTFSSGSSWDAIMANSFRACARI
jgi:acetylornithine deacetylase/succinyl-diaminopimelate desuccinylase-like protein